MKRAEEKHLETLENGTTYVVENLKNNFKSYLRLDDVKPEHIKGLYIWQVKDCEQLPVFKGYFYITEDITEYTEFAEKNGYFYNVISGGKIIDTNTENRKEGKNMKISEIERKKTESLINCISDYASGYICDVVAEIADRNTSIYYKDIFKFIAEHLEELNQTINEFGWNGCGADIIKAGQMTEYLLLEDKMFSELSAGIFNFIISYVEHDTSVKEISEKQLKQIINLSEKTDTNDKLENIIDSVNDIIFTA